MSFYQFLTVLRARKAIAFFAFFVTVLSAVAISLILPKTYESSTSLVVNYKGVDPVTGSSVPNQLIPGYLATQVDIIGSQNVSLKVVDKLELYADPEVVDSFYEATEGRGDIRNWLAKALLRNLTVTPSRESSVITLEYESNNPDAAAMLANAFAEAYIETNLQLKIDPSKRASEWFEKRVEGMRFNLITAQQRLSEYQREKNIVSADKRMDVEIARLSQLSQQLVVAQAELFHQKSRQEAVLKGGVRNLDSTVLADPIIRDLKVSLARSEVKLSELAERLSEQHPEYRAAVSEMQSLKRKLASEFRFAKSRIKSDESISEQKVTELESAINMQKQMLLEINDNRNMLDVYTRDVTDAQQILSLATQRLSQIVLEGASVESDISILNPGVVPSKASKPNLLVNFILSIFLGVVFSAIVVVIVEMLNRRIRSKDDVMEGVGLPVLGDIKYSKSSNWTLLTRFNAKKTIKNNTKT
ncbi:Chain length determinant exopolysaccharide biosynthesis protein EpsF [hydrothermal vent metagenome]|uniref:Chain length determinant exopolysaccharide biosynthesis protein EpsF n=1 Tax=hydrothermal vent metagenome TaxID=652676 RepID=A0A3B0WY62_9ZZZZ